MLPMAQKNSDDEFLEGEDEVNGSGGERSHPRKKARKPQGIKTEVAQGIYAIVSVIVAIIFILAAVGKAGPLGDVLYSWLTKLLGAGYALLPIVSILLAISFVKSLTRELNPLRLLSASVLVMTLLGMIELTFQGKGGIVGNIIAYPFLKLLGIYASWIVLLGICIASLLLLSNSRLPLQLLPRLARKLREKKFKFRTDAPVKIIGSSESVEAETADERPAADSEKERHPRDGALHLDEVMNDKNKIISWTSFKFRKRRDGTAYAPPSLTLLERDRGKPEVGDIKANANIIKRTLQNFGITVEMDEVIIGPSVTRYALKPAEGVKISRILALNNDLALALAAHPIRIEAPIPGKSLVGIEIPNSTKTTVGLAGIFSSAEFQSSDKALAVALGKSITGKSYIADLAKMPHLLIAGATGSGKSVAIHVMINSLLFRNSPEDLKFIMIDPKRVELTLYNKIPHLLTPVLTDAKKTILALKWATREMERRYNILEAESVRDIQSYHKNILAPKSAVSGGEEPPDAMPYIVIVIDELADIMHVYPRELESAVVRLAQMSRAVGIHLILSTQRPSVNIITGLIKANIPARMALQVSSQVDSRTILDMSGAEKLLGAGDMLYIGAEMAKPVRLQTPFITETEVKSVAAYLTKTYQDEIPTDIQFSEQLNGDRLGDIFSASEEFGDEGDDELYEDAREIIIAAGKGSTSYLQRRLKIGYARAARLMDMLEERGIIGPADGAKPRAVLRREENAESSADNGLNPF